jgi:hypothetical protein
MKWFWLVSIVASLAASTATADTSFVYKAPSGFSFTITPDGLTAIDLDGKTIAAGKWRTNSPGKSFGAGDILAQSMRVTSPTSVRVWQQQQYVTTTFDYIFDGEDLTIKARVENSHLTQTIGIAIFGTLVFTFEHGPTGHMMTGRSPDDISAMHPSHANKIGGSYSIDKGVYGVGMTPINTGFTRAFLCWSGQKSPDRSFRYSAQKAIPPGGADTFWMKMRLSKNTDWHHLLQPYKDHFLATYGPLRYKPDHRFFSQGVLGDESWRKEGNPLGVQPDRRVDLPQGMKSYCEAQVKRLKLANGQGTLLWAYQGADPRGAMYRTDFDVIPPAVLANFPIGRKIFKDAGMHFGLTARPGEFTYRGTWVHDYTSGIDPADKAYLDTYVRRFKNAIDLGATAFYTDSYGNSLEHAESMKYYRDKIGPNIQTFAEMHCDAMAPNSGFYTEVHYKGGDDPEKAYTLAWIDTNFIDICRWLVGDVGSVVGIRETGPPEAENVYHWLYRHHLTPLVADWNYGMKEEALGKLQAEYVDEKGNWRQ